MLRFLYADDLAKRSRLSETMFQDRAKQFKDRLNWDVEVNANGAERDAYDDLNPLYVIWETPQGTHGGSLRFLPTTGRTMVNEHFLDLTDGVRIESPFIWECTRFCLAPDASPRTSALLMLAGLEVGLAAGLSHAVGVFDARMVRIYRKIGWSPAILGRASAGGEQISVGLWDFAPSYRPALARKAGVSIEALAHWQARGEGPKRAA